MINSFKYLTLAILVLLNSACDQPLSLTAGHEPRIVAPEQPLPFKAAHKKLVGIFVDAKSTAIAPDGKSWATAYNNIQDAVLAAKGQIIYVAAGIYKRPQIVIDKISGLTLVAGYQAGDLWEKDLSSLNPQDEVVLDADGQVGESLIVIKGGSSAINLRGPLVFKDAQDASAIRMFGIVGAVLKDITISNARFENNRGVVDGAAIFIQYVQDLKLNKINAENNMASHGGVIYADKVNKMTVNGGVWQTNVATIEGGAFYAQDSQGLVLAPNLISGCGAFSGGAIYLTKLNKSEIGGVSLDRNSAVGGNGGAIYLDQVTDTTLNLGSAEIRANQTDKSGGALSMSKCQAITLRGGKFMANQALDMGGAIYDDKGIANRIRDSIFDANTATNYGGALVSSELEQGLSIDGVKFNGSKANTNCGGALFVTAQKDKSAISVINTEFANNSAVENGGAAMFKNIKGTVTFKNTKFSTNTANGFGGALALDAKSHKSARYIIDEGTTFRGNSSKKNAGGGAILAVFNPAHAPAIRLDFRTIIAVNDSTTNSSANPNGYFLLVSSRGVDKVPASGERAGAAAKKISDVLFPQLVDFNRTGLTIDEGKNVYQY